MIQIDLLKTKDFLFKYLPHVICVILAMMLLMKCNSSSELKTENEIIKKEVFLSKKLLKEVLRENKIKDKEIQEQKKAISFLDNQTQKKQARIIELRTENKYLKSSVNKYTTDDLVKFYIKRYNAPKKVFKTNLGIVFKDTIGKLIAADLIDYGFKVKELDLTKDILGNEIQVSKIKDTIINNLESQKKNLNFAIEEQGLIIDNQQVLADNQEKIIKKQTRTQNLLKISIPIVAILGVLSGVLIAK